MHKDVFTYCTGCKCLEKEECLRWTKHRELVDNKADIRSEKYIEPELCIKYNYNNFIFAPPYDQ